MPPTVTNKPISVTGDADEAQVEAKVSTAYVRPTPRDIDLQPDAPTPDPDSVAAWKALRAEPGYAKKWGLATEGDE